MCQSTTYVGGRDMKDNGLVTCNGFVEAEQK